MASGLLVRFPLRVEDRDVEIHVQLGVTAVAMIFSFACSAFKQDVETLQGVVACTKRAYSYFSGFTRGQL
jgi:hypothetical protein